MNSKCFAREVQLRPCRAVSVRPPLSRVLLLRAFVLNFALAKLVLSVRRLWPVLSPVLGTIWWTFVWLAALLPARPAFLPLRLMRPAARSGPKSFLAFLLPVSWQQRCLLLQSTVTQAVWGHGTHPGYWPTDSLRALRAQVFAALWQGERWLALLLLVLTLLAPAAIDPSFAFPFQCICTLGRFLCLPRVLHLVRRLFALGQGSSGLVGRLHCILRDNPCFRPLVEGPLQDPSVVGPDWRHQLRDAWRCSRWQSARRDRPDCWR